MALPAKKYYKGAPANALLTSSPSSGDTTMTVDTITGWPTSFPFYVVIDPGTSKEEKVRVTAISTLTLTVVRAQDNTTAVGHTSGAAIYPVFTAIEASEANEIASIMTTKGDIITNDGSSITRLAVGATNTHVLQVDSTATNGIKWGQVATAGIADSAITSAKIEDGTIVLADLAAALQAFLVPSGSISAYGGSSAPTGWLLCDGTNVSRSTYSTLFGLLGTKYGAGDGSTTFGLPNLKGKVPVGLDSTDSAFDDRGKTGGSKTSTAPHTHNIDHNHAAFDWTHDHASFSISGGAHDHEIHRTAQQLAAGTSGYYAVPLQDSGTSVGSTQFSNSHSHTVDVPSHTASIDIPALGTTASGASSAGATDGNLQPYIVVNYIIKT